MYRNLEYRETDGGRIRVSLDWDDETNTVLLTAEDFLGDRIEVVVPSTDSAHQAFLHPFAYADDLVALPTARVRWPGAGIA